MTEERRNRLIAAVTVCVILLIAILAVECVYQIVEVVTLQNRRKDIQTQITYYQQETEQLEKTLEYYKTYDGLLEKAYEFGFITG